MHADRVEGSAQIETGKEAGVSETIECLNDDEEGVVFLTVTASIVHAQMKCMVHFASE